MSESKTKAMTLLIAVLVAGGVIGWVAHQLIAPAPRAASQSVDALVTRYAKQLELDPTQQDSVRSILVRRQHETRTIWQEVHPRYETVRGRARTDIEAQLRPDQKTRFERMIAEEDAERTARLRDRGMTDSTQGQRQ
jgi:hypothetical protein